MKPVVLSLSSSVFLSFFMGCLEENFTWNGASSHKRQTLSLTLTHIHTLVPRHQLCEKHPVCDCGRILCDKHKKEVGPSMTHTHFLFFFFFQENDARCGSVENPAEHAIVKVKVRQRQQHVSPWRGRRTSVPRERRRVRWCELPVDESRSGTQRCSLNNAGDLKANMEMILFGWVFQNKVLHAINKMTLENGASVTHHEF